LIVKARTERRNWTDAV